MTDEKILLTARELLAGYFRERRLELGLSQAEVAERCGWKQPTVARIESGKFFLSTKQLWILCEALNLYFFVEPKESNSDIATLMRNRFSGGKKPSEN